MVVVLVLLATSNYSLSSGIPVEYTKSINTKHILTMSCQTFLVTTIVIIISLASAFQSTHVYPESSTTFLLQTVGSSYLDNLTPTPSSNNTNPWTPLLSLAASTGRGEFASPQESKMAESMILQLEQSMTLSSPTTSDHIRGTWNLLYSNTQLFRSSPFFMAGRAVCTTPDQAQQYNWFCDMHRAALAISSIQTVRQIISDTKLVSEFEVNVGAIPFLGVYSGGWPVTINGAIVSSADITPIQNDGTAWELFMDTVEIKGSNIPGLRQVLDQGLSLSSRTLGAWLEQNSPTYTNPKPIFKTTYLSDTKRISRDQDDNVFVYTKVSDRTEPTDYSSVLPDLGVARLLEGFNDAITKFYL